MVEIVRVRLIEKKESEGCEEAPISILESFKKIMARENGIPLLKESLRFEEIHVSLDDYAEADHLIFENGKEIFERNFKSFFIGGDTSILSPLLKAFNHVERNPLSFIFDAHGGGSILDMRHRNWLRRLLEKQFRGSSVILIGSRIYEREELSYLKKQGVFAMDISLIQEDKEGICDLLMERANTTSGFFLAIDFDSVDPAFAPGVSSPEVGGVSSRDLLYFIKRFVILKNLKGAALLGINPRYDIQNITCKLGARVLAELL